MRGILIGGLALLTAGVVAAPVPKELKRKKSYFPTVVGSKWEYVTEDGRDGHTREITAASEKDGAHTVTVVWRDGDSSMSWELREDATGLCRSKYESTEVDPPQLLLKPGIATGDEWDCQFTQGRLKCHYTRTVGKPEKVTTPAGEYTAVPITQVDPTDPDDTATIWYAEGVGMVKLHEKGTAPLVLKAYTAGKEK